MTSFILNCFAKLIRASVFWIDDEVEIEVNYLYKK